MFTRTLTAGLLATLPLATLPLTAFAADPVQVKTVDVSIALEALTNTEAATRFATIEADLENAIAAGLIDRTDPENGVTLEIDLAELELSNSFTEAFNFADTKLIGRVKVTGPAANPAVTSYDLMVDVNSSMPYFPAGTVVETLPVDSAVYYTTLITAFADAVVRKLDE